MIPSAFSRTGTNIYGQQLRDIIEIELSAMTSQGLSRHIAGIELLPLDLF